jgi:hypothetical protein
MAKKIRRFLRGHSKKGCCVIKGKVKHASGTAYILKCDKHPTRMYWWYDSWSLNDSFLYKDLEEEKSLRQNGYDIWNKAFDLWHKKDKVKRVRRIKIIDVKERFKAQFKRVIKLI